MSENAMNKTLTELDGIEWGEPNFESYVVINCHRLRRVPLNRFTLEDIRLLVGQSMGLLYLMPMALQCLRKNPSYRRRFLPRRFAVSPSCVRKRTSGAKTRRGAGKSRMLSPR